jgi:hypothetical protein
LKRLPGELPAWLTTPRLLTLAHATGLVSCLLPWVSLMAVRAPPLAITGDLVGDLGALALGVPATTAVAAASSILVGRAKTADRAAAASVIGSGLAFALSRCAVVFHIFANTEAFNGPIVVSNGTAHVGSMLGVAMVPQLISSFGTGAFVGSLVGLALARPAMWVARRAHGTRDVSSGRALFGVGVWLFVPAAISAMMATFALLASRRLDLPLVAWSIAAPSLATLGAVLGAGLLWRRSRWIEAVRRGEVPGYRIRSAEEADPALPGLEAPVRPDHGVLEEVVATGDNDPYRGGGDVVQPIARVER